MSLLDLEHLFAPQIPESSAQSLRVLGCATKEWALRVSGSKSVTNRALVLAALCGKPLEIASPLLSDDTWWGFRALDAMGFALDVSGLPEKAIVHPPESRAVQESVSLFVGQAGTLARFVPAVLLNWNRIHPQAPVKTFRMEADPQLMRRPLSPLVGALRQWGARITGESLPLEMAPSDLQGACTIDGSQSGQFLSGLLLAAAAAGHACRIERTHTLVQPDYVRITLAMLQAFGVQIECDAELTRFFIPQQRWQAPECYVIEADASTACYFASLASVLRVNLKVENIGSNTLQPDFQFIQMLQKFGFNVTVRPTAFEVWGASAEQTDSDELHFDMSACSDQALTAGVMALCTGRGVRVSGVAHIRHHESDRIAAFCANCAQLGIVVEEHADGFRVPSGVQAQHLSGVWPTHGDHRFALAGIVLAACAPRVAVLDAACMKKTAPHFVRQLTQCGVLFDS